MCLFYQYDKLRRNVIVMKKKANRTIKYIAVLGLCAFALSKTHLLDDVINNKKNIPSTVSDTHSFYKSPEVIILSENTGDLIELDLMGFLDDASTNATASSENTPEATYNQTIVPPLGNMADDTALPAISELPESVNLELNLIKQYPELPSGCESVALTMLLDYYGYPLDKTTIANDYLIYNEDNFVMGFHGDPFSSHGGGCYAPGMVNTANRFFVQNSSPFRAIDITGTELNDLYYYLAVGSPVMLWSTIDLKPGIKCGSVIQYGDISYQWDKREHCVILSGYNLADNTVTIYDSISGIKTYNADQLKASYDSMWNMAMVIK